MSMLEAINQVINHLNQISVAGYENVKKVTVSIELLGAVSQLIEQQEAEQRKLQEADQQKQQEAANEEAAVDG